MRKVNIQKPFQNGLIMLLNFSMLILFAISIAYWFWVFFKPETMADMVPVEPATQAIAPIIQAGHWFDDKQVTIHSNPALPLDFKLVGVLSAAMKQSGFAVFAMQDGKQRSVIENQEIVPGILLHRVHAKGVTIIQNGQKTEMVLQGSEQVDQLSQALKNSIQVENQTIAGQPAQTKAGATTAAEPTFNIQEIIKRNNVAQ